MAHIANKIDAKDKNLAEVLRGQRYTIESFQREYRWKTENIEALISDLSSSFLRNYKEGDKIEDYVNYDCYYVGPIVLCDEKRELSIVDGQQRLTSFTLLLLFLKNAQNKFSIDPEQTKDLKEFLYVTKGGKTTLILNVIDRINVLQHLYINPEIPFKVNQNLDMNYDDQSKIKIKDDSVENIIARYEDITNRFPSEINTKEILPIFIEWLLEKVVFVEVKAYSLVNAFTIFETMNDRGLSLNSSEILKGILISKIEDELKSEEMNLFWKERISKINSIIGIDKDLDFFRAWLRAKYAETIRPTKQGATNEDFEDIGSQFHSWVKNNPSKTFLKQSDDYYFFIRSDFDFFSNLYIDLFEIKNNNVVGFEEIYISSFYPIADSLAYPLLISPITKIDDKDTIDKKIKLTSKFIDVFTLSRVVLGKTITQSSIRYLIYELVKSIRNLDLDKLEQKFRIELERFHLLPASPFGLLHRMNNWGFYHYLYARLLYKINPETNFNSLLRSKKQNSFILYKIFKVEEKPPYEEDIIWQFLIDSVACYCLVRRNDLDNIESKEGIEKLNYLIIQGYMPEMDEFKIDGVSEFIFERDRQLRRLFDEILSF